MKQHGVGDTEPGDYVMVAVRDTGIGMDRETQARIFEPFFTTKESGRGTGLGLAMVYGIVKQSGGYVWVYSEPGQGTTFKIYLPRSEDAVRAIQRDTIRIEDLRGTERVLLVEDEDPVREVSARLLKRAGYTVVDSKDGQRALDEFDRHHAAFDIVITDMAMPGMGGRELAQRLRSRSPDIPIVFMSGYTDDEELRSSLVDSRALFIEKPFTPELLLSKVREALVSDDVAQSA
jgi:CheY-like chemotaxis protein